MRAALTHCQSLCLDMTFLNPTPTAPAPPPYVVRQELATRNGEGDSHWTVHVLLMMYFNRLHQP